MANARPPFTKTLGAMGAQTALVWLLVVVVLVWFGLMAWVFRRLRLRHSELFERLGRPALFHGDWTRSRWPFLRLVLTRGYAKFGDRALQVACDLMLGLLPIYVLIFVYLFY
jgi:hypothetical protein